MNKLSGSSKSIQSGLSNTHMENDNQFTNHKTLSSTLDEIHCNKNTDQSNKPMSALVSPVKIPKSSLQSLYETNEEYCEKKKEPLESKLESGLYNNNNNHGKTNHNKEEKVTPAKRISVEGGFEPWNNDKTDLDNPKRYTYSKDRMFTLKERNNENTKSKDTISTTTYRTNSLSDMKIGIHRKISSERTKPKRLRKHSSLKEFKIQYSNNLQSLKQRDKMKTKCHQKEGKRVGLPAELFANDVSFSMKNNNRNQNISYYTPPARIKSPSANRVENINGSFYSISNSSPVSSYSNPFFQSDDVIYSSPLIPASTSPLDLNEATVKANHLVAKNNITASKNQRPNTNDFNV